jgi:hypothetical protein
VRFRLGSPAMMSRCPNCAIAFADDDTISPHA